MLRLGCDLDGVLADLEGVMRREAQRLWPEKELVGLPAAVGAQEETPTTAGDDLSGEEQRVTPATLALTDADQRALWREIHGITNFWETLDEIEEGAVQRLADVAEVRRWEVIFLTSRPWCAGDTVQVQSQRWLDRLGFQHPSVFVVKGSRGKIADALSLDVVIDDRPENCLDVVLESKARAILIWRGDAGTVSTSARRLGIGGVSSVNACLDILEQADSTSNESNFVDRLKRLLGLKPSSQPMGVFR